MVASPLCAVAPSSTDGARKQHGVHRDGRVLDFGADRPMPQRK